MTDTKIKEKEEKVIETSENINTELNNNNQNDTTQDTSSTTEDKKENINSEITKNGAEEKGKSEVEIKKEENKKPSFQDNFKNKKPFQKNFRRSRKPFKREKPEFDQKILSLRRVTRVMAGGRRFSFSVAMVIGDKKGRVGVGLGKANDTTSAIQKAVRNAKKNMVRIKLTENGSVPYDVEAKYKASNISIRPVSGKGLAAGGAVRTVLEFVGMKEVGAKILSRSKNHFNNAKATILALAPFSEKITIIESSQKKLFKKKPFQPFHKRGNDEKKDFSKDLNNTISSKISEDSNNKK